MEVRIPSLFSLTDVNENLFLSVFFIVNRIVFGKQQWRLIVGRCLVVNVLESGDNSSRTVDINLRRDERIIADQVHG